MGMAGCGDAPVSAILVTHAHRDHTAGVGVLARRLGVGVYATEGTWFEMGALSLGIPEAQRHTIGSTEQWRIGCLELESFPTSHDALESVGYVVRREGGGGALGIATDCGVFTDRMERLLRGVQILALEANHDADMPRTGKYPHYLKKRIAGIDGHLSNDDAGAALGRIAGGCLQHVMLAHLSQENNTKEKALASVRLALPTEGPALSVAHRCLPSEWIIVDEPNVAACGIAPGADFRASGALRPAMQSARRTGQATVCTGQATVRTGQGTEGI